MNWKRLAICLSLFIVMIAALFLLLNEPATDSGDCNDVVEGTVTWVDEDDRIEIVQEFPNDAEPVLSGADITEWHWSPVNNEPKIITTDKPIQIDHTDTPEPVCPHCGKDKWEAWYSLNRLKQIVDYDNGNTHLSISYLENHTLENHSRCKECGKDFTISKYKLWKVIKGIKYKSDGWVYTTERIKP